MFNILKYDLELSDAALLSSYIERYGRLKSPDNIRKMRAQDRVGLYIAEIRWNFEKTIPIFNRIYDTASKNGYYEVTQIFNDPYKIEKI